MIGGEYYDPGDRELGEMRENIQCLQYEYNQTTVKDKEKRKALLQKMLHPESKSCTLRAPIYFDYGINTIVGEGVFMNYNTVLLDVCRIEIGNLTQIGPNCQILTADHPRDSGDREKGLEFGKPIKIGKNVWMGGGVIVLPGVTIGDHAIIGAGSVVTRDIPSHATAYGNPARVKDLTRATS